LATQIILFASPFFFLLIFIELWVNHKKQRKVYRFNDAITSLSLGVISQTKKLVIFTFAVFVYDWFAESLAVSQLPTSSAFTWIFGFVLYDFLYYWYHRISHQINFLCAAHVVHHQSEEYNLTTALRQTSSSVGAWLFYIPSFIIGVPAEVFFVSGALNLIYQFWVHTQLIGKLGWYETIFVTPSHHRVHHGQNQVYIDKNHGGVFIVWDKLFGTFQEELANEKVVYGVRRPVLSFNPIWANVHTWYSLLLDSIRTKRFIDKLRIWFMPTGWRPDDVMEKYPLIKHPVEQQIKFNPESNFASKLYVLFQYVCFLFLGISFIQYQQSMEFTNQFLFWVLITLPFMGCGYLLEARKKAISFELVRLLSSALMAIFFLDYSSGFQLKIVLAYTLLSLVILSWVYRESFVRKESSTDGINIVTD